MNDMKSEAARHIDELRRTNPEIDEWIWDQVGWRLQSMYITGALDVTSATPTVEQMKTAGVSNGNA